jgi:hypothetical protein
MTDADHGRYDVILADPPWSYHGAQTMPAAAAKHYGTMPDEELLHFTGITDRLYPRHGVPHRVGAHIPRGRVRVGEDESRSGQNWM